MIQLVVSGNRIVAHGEDCFLSMGGTVVCTEPERVFQNATVVFHDGAIPSDIDTVGYEYHDGEFVPCAPFGKGTGNIAVLCGDTCKSIKDSGISVTDISKMKMVTYYGKGNGRAACISKEQVGFVPALVVVSRAQSDSGTGEKIVGIATRSGGFCVLDNQGSGTIGHEDGFCGMQSWVENDTIYWETAFDSPINWNEMGYEYLALVFGRGESNG